MVFQRSSKTSPSMSGCLTMLCGRQMSSSRSYQEISQNRSFANVMVHMGSAIETMAEESTAFRYSLQRFSVATEWAFKRATSPSSNTRCSMCGSACDSNTFSADLLRSWKHFARIHAQTPLNFSPAHAHTSETTAERKSRPISSGVSPVTPTTRSVWPSFSHSWSISSRRSEIITITG